MFTNQGKAIFPNQDGITVDSLRNREFSNVEINALIKQFEEASRVIDNLQQMVFIPVLQRPIKGAFISASN